MFQSYWTTSKPILVSGAPNMESLFGQQSEIGFLLGFHVCLGGYMPRNLVDSD